MTTKKKHINKSKSNCFDLGGGIVSALGGASGLVGLGINNLNIPTTQNSKMTALTNELLMSLMLNYKPIEFQLANVGGLALSGLASGASAGMALGPWGAAIGGLVGGLSGGITSMIGNDKKQQLEQLLKTQLMRAFSTQANTIGLNSFNNSLAQSLAFGGKLFDQGGNLYSDLPNLATHGGEFGNGGIEINAGGTHELNPLGGIPMGMGLNGKPNLVEEGEYKFKDYIFSNRLKVDKTTTFAELAKKDSKESSERPNDPISKNGLDKSMGELQKKQEVVKLKKQQKELNMMQMEMLKLGVDPNTFMQSPQLMAQGGELPQGIEPNLQRVMQLVEGWLQLGMSPLLILRQLITAGISSLLAQSVIELATQDLSQLNQLLNTQLLTPGQPQLMALGGNILAEGTPPGGLFGVMPYTNQVNGNHVNPYEQTNTPLNLIVGGVNMNAIVNGTNPLANPVESKGLTQDNILRYAPIAASGLASLTDALGVTNTPDYEVANDLLGLDTLGVKGTKLSDFVNYKPLDTNYLTNQLGANAASTREGLRNISGGNRATYMAGLLGADASYNLGLGQLGRLAAEYNQGLKMQVADFNRGTNQFNAQQSNWELGINTQLKEGSIKMKAQMKAAARQESRGAKMNNLNTFVEGLGDFGKEKDQQAMINWMISKGLFGTVKANGGKLNNKK